MPHQLAFQAGDFVNGLLQKLLLVAGLFQKRSGHGAGVWAIEQAASLLFYFKLLLWRELHCHPLTEVHGAIVVGYMVMLPMQCPQCSSSRIRAIATNGHEPDRVTRKRRCDSCGHDWYTVELQVSKAIIGWSRVTTEGQSKPVLRVPVEIAVGSKAV